MITTDQIAEDYAVALEQYSIRMRSLLVAETPENQADQDALDAMRSRVDALASKLRNLTGLGYFDYLRRQQS